MKCHFKRIARSTLTTADYPTVIRLKMVVPLERYTYGLENMPLVRYEKPDQVVRVDILLDAAQLDRY